jgi:hypothetical protein
MKTNKFKFESDGDSVIAKRFISGRLTPKRYEIVKRYVRTFNRDNQFPYGVSPSGYAYTCGHEHDCCGCSTGKGMDFELYSNGDTAIFEIIFYEGFNY